MPIYRVTLKDPATPHTPFLIRAPLARVAQYTAICMFQASVPKAPGGAMPPLDPDGTLCVQVHDAVYPETGPLEILEPAHHGKREARVWRSDHRSYPWGVEQRCNRKTCPSPGHGWRRARRRP